MSILIECATKLYAVYVPILRSDAEERVPAATTRLPDERVSYYWDGSAELVKAY
jgi:hypothetical protein